MFKDLVANYYAPLRPYVNRYACKLRRFLWDWLPDLLVIAVCAWLFIQIWEFCFWR